MAVSYTVTAVHSEGNLKSVHGTFTTAAGDGNGETLGASTHGLNYIVDYQITLDTGAIATQTPKVTISSGTLTWTVEDTLGYSGKFFVKGR